MADYIIYRSGANTVARNTANGTDQFTNTAAESVFNSCISTLSSGGTGGSIYVKRGTYDIGAMITLADNIHIIGEHRDFVTLNSTTASDSILKRTGTITTGFKLKNVTLKSAGLASPIYLA